MQERAALAALCRGVHVPKKIWTVYDQEWKTPVKKTPLTSEHWPALIGALLLSARLCDNPERGQALKYINAALCVIDLYREQGGDAGLEELALWAREALAEAVAR